MYGRTMYILLVALFAAQITGCATTPRYKGVAQGGNAENQLGIYVDEALQVTAIDPGSAAERAGVQIGDRLVSLTWVLSEAPAEIPATEGNASSAEESAEDAGAPAATLMRPPPGVENKTIAFTDAEGIGELIGYSVPLRLQVVRQDRVVELTIIPAPATEAAAAQTTQAAHHY